MSVQPANSKPTTAAPGSLDALVTDEATLARRFVRITDRQPNGIVAFEFSVGWPDMSVELANPKEIFNEFCYKNKVELLT